MLTHASASDAWARGEIAQVRETVAECAALPWSEVVQTMGEHLEWGPPTGRNAG